MTRGAGGETSPSGSDSRSAGVRIDFRRGARWVMLAGVAFEWCLFIRHLVIVAAYLHIRSTHHY